MAKWVKKWSVPNDPYIVSQANDGSWGCSCKAWIYKRTQCEHIQMVQAGGGTLTFDATVQIPVPPAEAPKKETSKQRQAPKEPDGLAEILRNAPFKINWSN